MVYVTRKKTFELKINNVSRGSSVREVAKLGAGRVSDQMLAGFQIFLFPVASRRAVKAQSIQWVTEVRSLAVKSTRREPDH